MHFGLRDWSLITGRGGLQNGRGAREVLPLRKGGGGGNSFSHAEGGGTQKVLAMLKGGGGHTKFWGNFYAVAGSFSHFERGGGSGAKLSTL